MSRSYSDEEKTAAIEKILEAIPDAPPTMGLRAICENAGATASTFLRWVDENDKLAERYARAMAFRVEADVDRINEISMAPAVTVSTEYGEHVDTGDVALRRLQVDSLKWLASKRVPKKYGERLDLEHSGSVKTTGDFNLSKLSDEKLAQLRALAAEAQPDAPSDS